MLAKLQKGAGGHAGTRNRAEAANVRITRAPVACNSVLLFFGVL